MSDLLSLSYNKSHSNLPFRNPLVTEIRSVSMHCHLHRRSFESLTRSSHRTKCVPFSIPRRALIVPNWKICSARGTPKSYCVIKTRKSFIDTNSNNRFNNSCNLCNNSNSSSTSCSKCNKVRLRQSHIKTTIIHLPGVSEGFRRVTSRIPKCYE
jgi:hypothetical protein